MEKSLSCFMKNTPNKFSKKKLCITHFIITKFMQITNKMTWEYYKPTKKRAQLFYILLNPIKTRPAVYSR
jgi:hypothetical protein